VSGVKWHTSEEARAHDHFVCVDSDGKRWRWQVFRLGLRKADGYAMSRLKARHAAVKAAKKLEARP
jgi:hypothetical protein